MNQLSEAMAMTTNGATNVTRRTNLSTFVKMQEKEWGSFWYTDPHYYCVLEKFSNWPEVGIYKRKQESKKTRTRPRKKEKTFFYKFPPQNKQ